MVQPPPVKEVPKDSRKSFKDTVKEVIAPPEVELLSAQWITDIRTNSVIHGAVSTAHRSLISDRDSLIKGMYCISCIIILINTYAYAYIY
jgi:hypothetical protein